MMPGLRNWHISGIVVYEYTSLSKAISAMGRRPLGLKWIDTNKGDETNFQIRSRLVCTEVRPRGTDAIFSATPPLESLRILMSLLSQPVDDANDPYCLTLADVSRAHFYAKAEREVYIKLPAEDPRSGEKDLCGRLLRTMYGTLDAAERWGEHYSAILTSNGFKRGEASPCQFFHKAWGVRLMVHGDDFIMVAKKAGRDRTIKLLQSHFKWSTGLLGPWRECPENCEFWAGLL